MFKKSKKELIEEIHTMKLFAEGAITVYDFWEEFNNNHKLKDLIYNDKLLPIKNKPFLYENLNLDFLYHRCEIFRVVKCYFMRRKIELNFNSDDEKTYSELLDNVPSYVDIDSKWFLENVLNKCTFPYGSKERKNFFKQTVKEMYRYVNRPPKWLHSSEWPIGANGPMVFIKQSNYPNNFDCDMIQFVFYDEHKKEEHIIIQED